MRVIVEYVCDWNSENGDDQTGHIAVTTPTGRIEGTWSCTGGMGDGAVLVSNTTEEYTDDEAYSILNATDLCQGNGTCDGDLQPGGVDWTLTNVVWRETVG